MDAETHKKIEANIFRHALGAVENWDSFRWHLDNAKQCDTWKLHSSQALAIDVFGVVKQLGQRDKDCVLNAVARRVGVPEGGPWAIELEWVDEHNLLKETRKKTQVDAFACSPYAVILFEGKFKERDGGTCSQVRRLPTGQIQCNGNYENQFNPVEQCASRCSLTGKGIRYWDIIPKIFHLDSEVDYSPCPFSGSRYQWMRNMVLGSAFTRQRCRSNCDCAQFSPRRPTIGDCCEQPASSVEGSERHTKLNKLSLGEEEPNRGAAAANFCQTVGDRFSD